MNISLPFLSRTSKRRGGRPAIGRRTLLIATGCVALLAGVPAGVMAFSPPQDEIIGHVTVDVPAARPYQEVPPPRSRPSSGIAVR